MTEYLMLTTFAAFAVVAGAALAGAMYVLADRARVGEANRSEPGFYG